MSRLNIIASAVGTERAVKENLAQCFGYMSDCGVFNLHPFDTAMVKKQTNICSLFVNYWLNYGNGLIYSPHLSMVNLCLASKLVVLNFVLDRQIMSYCTQ